MSFHERMCADADFRKAWAEMVDDGWFEDGEEACFAMWEKAKEHFAAAPEASGPGKQVAKVALSDAPGVLNINDKAFWVLGWNAAVERMRTRPSAKQEQP